MRSTEPGGRGPRLVEEMKYQGCANLIAWRCPKYRIFSLAYYRDEA